MPGSGVVDGLHDQLARLDALATQLVEGGSIDGPCSLWRSRGDGHDGFSSIRPRVTAR